MSLTLDAAPIPHTPSPIPPPLLLVLVPLIRRTPMGGMTKCVVRTHIVPVVPQRRSKRRFQARIGIEIEIVAINYDWGEECGGWGSNKSNFGDSTRDTDKNGVVLPTTSGTPGPMPRTGPSPDRLTIGPLLIKASVTKKRRNNPLGDSC